MVVGAAGLVALTLVLGVAAGLYLLFKFMSVDRIGGVEVDAAKSGEARNYLVVGSDVRTDGSVGGRRSDTVMVVRVDPRSNHAAVLSIPRDLVVPIAGTGEKDRINSAYSHSRATLMDTIRDSLGIELQHYVEIDFESFEGLVDSAGGVPLWFGSPVKDERSGLFVPESGCVVLDGEQALAFVRSRELQYLTSSGRWSVPDPTADLGRIERQQVFIRRVLMEAKQQIASNPARIPQLVNRAVDAVAVDEEMSIGDLVDLANRLKDFDPDNLRTYSLPVVETGDGATVALEEAEAAPVLAYFRGRDLEEVAPEMVTVQVLNGSHVPGQAGEASKAFEKLGFMVTEPDTSPEPQESTVVYHRPGDERFARRLLRHIGVEGGSGAGSLAGTKPRDDLGLEPGEVVVVTGHDFTTVYTSPTALDVKRFNPDSSQDLSASPGAASTSGDAESAQTAEPDETAPLPPPSSSNVDSTEFIVGDPPEGAC